MPDPIRHGTVDLSKETRSAREIVSAGTEGLGEDISYGEAIKALEATIHDLREQASVERLREAEREIQASGGASISMAEMKRRLELADEA